MHLFLSTNLSSQVKKNLSSLLEHPDNFGKGQGFFYTATDAFIAG